MKTSKLIFLLPLIGLGIASAHAQQIKQAHLNTDGSIHTTIIENTSGIQPTILNNEQKENFPIGLPANPTFKNSRGLTLVDIDGDGVDEIFHAADNKVVAYSDNGDLLWEKPIIGVGTYPPTVVDLRGDGTHQLIQTTMMTGRIYLLDAATGEDLDGWPLNFNNNMILSAASVADLTGDGKMDIVFCERNTAAEGHIHAVDIAGNPINDNWPLVVPGTPAVTPSMGDVNNDGTIDIVFGLSSGMYYAVDSQSAAPLEGFPVTLENRSISYQSPILVDLTGDDNLEIVAASHGDTPGFFVLNHQGEMLEGWPHNREGWTYTPPTVVDIDDDGEYEIFFSDRNTSGTAGESLPVIFAYDKDGTPIEEMSYEKYGGTEGVMTIADINDDGVMEIIFPSVITEEDHGFIHAYALDGSGEIAGFPKRPKGFTFMNGAVIGATSDNKMKLVANSHTTMFGVEPDSTFINVYELNVPYDTTKILSNGYKGDNTRAGMRTKSEVIGTPEFNQFEIEIYPNPSDGKIAIISPKNLKNLAVQVIGIDGKMVWAQDNLRLNLGTNELNFGILRSGMYFLTISDGTMHSIKKLIIR